MVLVLKSTEKNDPRYLTCCDKIRVIDAALILAYLSILFYIVVSITAVTADNNAIFGIALTSLLPAVLVVAGIHMKKHKFLIPVLIVEAMFAVFYVGNILIALINLCADTNWTLLEGMNSSLTPWTTGWFTLVVYSVFIIWRLAVYFSCYKYLKERPHTVQTAFI